MSTGPGHPEGTGHEPLTPEERALAERLARLAPSGEPSPALDARILAAARAAASAPATAAPAAGRRRARRRWPVAVGAAATLVIVAGLAWQLRPVDEMQVRYSEAPRAVAPTVAADSASTEAAGNGEPGASAPPPPAPAVAPRDAGADAAAPVAPAPATVPSPAPAPVRRAEAPATTVAEPPADAGQRKPQAFTQRQEAPPPPPEEPPVVFDEPSPMDMPAPASAQVPASPPPPAPPAPAPEAAGKAGPQSAATEAAAADAAAATEDAGARRQRLLLPAADAAKQRASDAGGERARTAGEAEAAGGDAGTLDRIQVTGTRIDRFGDQPLDEQPPASADSPQVQQAWLHRVRQLVAEGRLDAARASLREYQRRYPKAVLPDDLRALLPAQ